MSEEEKRRCIILGICPPPPPSFAGEGESESPRVAALREYLSTSSVSAVDLDAVLSLIDEALAMQGL